MAGIKLTRATVDDGSGPKINFRWNEYGFTGGGRTKRLAPGVWIHRRWTDEEARGIPGLAEYGVKVDVRRLDDECDFDFDGCYWTRRSWCREDPERWIEKKQVVPLMSREVPKDASDGKYVDLEFPVLEQFFFRRIVFDEFHEYLFSSKNEENDPRIVCRFTVSLHQRYRCCVGLLVESFFVWKVPQCWRSTA